MGLPDDSGIETYWLDEAPTFEHHGGSFTCTLFANDRKFRFQGPNEFMAIGMGNAARTYAKSIQGNILAFRRRRKKQQH